MILRTNIIIRMNINKYLAIVPHLHGETLGMCLIISRE